MDKISSLRHIESKTEYRQYLTFNVADSLYGFSVNDIREVLEYSHIQNLTRIPMSPEVITGVINLRGEILPIVDLSYRLYGKKSILSKNTTVVIITLEFGGETIVLGAMVDAIKSVLDVPVENITAPPDFGANVPREFMDSVGQTEDGSIIFLNTQNVFSVDDLSVVQDASSCLEKMLSMRTVDDQEFGLDHKRDKSEDEKEANEDAHYFVALLIGAEFYGIDMIYVHEIIKISEMTHVPNSLPFMKGVINLRGVIIPIVDMRLRCSLKEKKHDKNTAALIINLNDKLIGLIVDSVYEVISIPLKQIQNIPHYSAQIDRDFIMGMYEKDERIIVIIEVDNILSSDEKVILDNEFYNADLSKDNE